MKKLLELGEYYVSDFLNKSEEEGLNPLDYSVNKLNAFESKSLSEFSFLLRIVQNIFECIKRKFLFINVFF